MTKGLFSRLWKRTTEKVYPMSRELVNRLAPQFGSHFSLQLTVKVESRVWRKSWASRAASGVPGVSAGNHSRGLLVDFQSDPKQTRQ